jgi:hypothetical protein
MVTPPPQTPTTGQPDDLGYTRMVDLAESVLDELAGSSPDWCQIAREAHELADLAGRCCEGS